MIGNVIGFIALVYFLGMIGTVWWEEIRDTQVRFVDVVANIGGVVVVFGIVALLGVVIRLF